MKKQKKHKLKLLKFRKNEPRPTAKTVLRELMAEDVKDVVCIGYYSDGTFLLKSSAMSRQAANWLLDNGKLHVLSVEREDG